MTPSQPSRSLLTNGAIVPPKEKVATLQHGKPIMSAALEHSVKAAVIQYKDKNKWREWGMAHYRGQGSCILLYGPPGVGKTIIARYLCKLIGYGLRELDISTFGSNQPGENERRLEEFFLECERDGKALFMDECDSILWDRAKAGADSMWMVGVINKLLSLIGKFKHPLFLATNRRQELDPALNRRLIAEIEVPRPEYAERMRLWQQKIPSKFPFQPTPVQLQELAAYGLSGAEIENCVIKAAQEAIISKRNPQYDDLCNVARTEAAKHTSSN